MKTKIIKKKKIPNKPKIKESPAKTLIQILKGSKNSTANIS